MHWPVLSPALIPVVEKCIKILFSAFFSVKCRNKIGETIPDSGLVNTTNWDKVFPFSPIAHRT